MVCLSTSSRIDAEPQRSKEKTNAHSMFWRHWMKSEQRVKYLSASISNFTHLFIGNIHRHPLFLHRICFGETSPARL
jgi:hypothetical protein